MTRKNRTTLAVSRKTSDKLCGLSDDLSPVLLRKLGLGAVVQLVADYFLELRERGELDIGLVMRLARDVPKQGRRKRSGFASEEEERAWKLMKRYENHTLNKADVAVRLGVNPKFQEPKEFFSPGELEVYEKVYGGIGPEDFLRDR